MRSQHAAPRSTLRSSRQGLMQLTIPTPLKSSLLARAPDWPRHRCCCCYCRHAAVKIPYERRLNDSTEWLTACRNWRRRFLVNFCLNSQHFRIPTQAVILVVNGQFSDFYSAVIIRQGLFSPSVQPLFGLVLKLHGLAMSGLAMSTLLHGLTLSSLAMSGLAISAFPNVQQIIDHLRSRFAA